MSWNRVTTPQPAVILSSPDPHYAASKTAANGTTDSPVSPMSAADPVSSSSSSTTPSSSSLLSRIQILSTRLPKGWINPASGAGAGLASAVVTCPLDVIKTKLQAQGGFAHRAIKGEYPSSAHLYKGITGTARIIWREEGLRGLYRGLGPMLLGYLPTWAVYMTVYENTRDFWFDQSGNWWVARCGSSLTAGACSTVLTNPIWVVKTRLMSQSNNKGAAAMLRAPWHYTSTLDAFRKMYRTEGIRSFYAGLSPALLGLTHVAVQFPLYEWLKMKFTGYGMGEHPPEGESNFLGISAATFLSKVCASTATYPHEVLRTRLQNQQRSQASSDGMLSAPRYKGLIHMSKIMLKEEGIGAFYAGIVVNLVRALPAAMTTMLTYEYLQGTILQLQAHGEQLKAAESGSAI